MAGGGKHVWKGRMGSSIVVEVDPRELHKMEAELETVISLSLSLSLCVAGRRRGHSPDAKKCAHLACHSLQTDRPNPQSHFYA